MALSLWEGHAVAFMLGIGVLLGTDERQEEVGHRFIMFEHDAENNFVPPPEYTNEKVKVPKTGQTSGASTGQ
ncbi:uncharacterized protein EDB93DRAFT_1250057 [Suillus bovinus]|uniref:uncharacterized protein n=1 Tax=Suillus bovinus TaxID=48563 RepID=UPI001B86BF52|nr:uncharacterized protein EDB93DRAFT_1250057 [Suillus bovinus]KAG2149134.1 hypothetical protein EDB93DRAFT_1250057 [Suillus bovinus]